MHKGNFYVMTLNENRIKAGFSRNLEKRMQQGKCFIPETKVYATWYCPNQTMEALAMEWIAKDFQQIGGEVFICTDLPKLSRILDEFFGEPHQSVLRAQSNKFFQRKNQEREISKQFWANMDRTDPDHIKKAMQTFIVSRTAITPPVIDRIPNTPSDISKPPRLPKFPPRRRKS